MQPRTPAPRTDRTLVAVTVALVVVLLTGCGVRLETPPPAPLVPDVNEQARQRASADSVALSVLAGAPAPGADPAAPPAQDPVEALRAAVAADAAAHLDRLGGLYDAGPGTTDDTEPDRPPTPAATPAPAPEPTVATPQALVTALTESAANARSDTATVTDGPLARLLGSISVSRQLAAARLARATGVAGPPEPTVTVSAESAAGLTGADLTPLVASEDAAGYGLEVVAAKHSDDLRRRAADRAAAHRARAEGWAALADLDGTGPDPRRVAYALPGGLEDPAAAAALAQSLETSVAAHYASLVADADPDARPALVDAVTEATASAVAWGAVPPALPGLPEQAAG